MIVRCAVVTWIPSPDLQFSRRRRVPSPALLVSPGAPATRLGRMVDWAGHEQPCREAWRRAAAENGWWRTSEGPREAITGASAAF